MKDTLKPYRLAAEAKAKKLVDNLINGRHHKQPLGGATRLKVEFNYKKGYTLPLP